MEENKGIFLIKENEDGGRIAALPTKEETLMTLATLDTEYEKYLASLPPKVRMRVLVSRRGISTGLHAIAPLACLGPERCLFLAKCPIPDRNDRGEIGDIKDDRDYPMGKDCVLEKFFIQQKMVEYYQHLDVDPSNPVEMSIVNELALIDLYKNRAIMIMAVGDKREEGRDFMKTDILGYSESGDAAEISKIHPAVEMIDRLEKRREKWLDKLMETRKSKADWVARMGGEKIESKTLKEIQDLRELITRTLPGVEGRIAMLPDAEEAVLLDD